MQQDELPKRKSMRQHGYDYSHAGYYFITFCTKDKQPLLGKIAVGDAPPRVPHYNPHTAHTLHDIIIPHCILTEYGVFVDALIQKTSSIYTDAIIDKYIIMPNHIHMVISIADNGTRGGASPTKALIPKIIQSIKSMTTKHFGHNLWQRSYHDHIIRNEVDYKQIWHYIDNNPAKWAEDCYNTNS